MHRDFEIFTRPDAKPVAVKHGFSWPAFFLTWIWAFARRLWIHGAVLIAAWVGLAAIALVVFRGDAVLTGILALMFLYLVGAKANAWCAAKLERDGYGFSGLVSAKSPSSAVSVFLVGGRATTPIRSRSVSFLSMPPWLQSIGAIVMLTWKAALRYRLFVVIAVLLLGAVVGLPVLVKDDGTARGFTQILLTYTLSVITALLGLSTLWLSCGTLARDIDECQIQVVVTKPISRWQIWLGKWLGIMTLNAALLGMAGVCVYGLLLWRATRLPVDQQRVLQNEVLIARGSAREQDYTKDIEADTERVMAERLKAEPVAEVDRAELRRQIRERVKAEYQIVPPGYRRVWNIDLSHRKEFLRDRPLQLRIKFNTGQIRPSATFLGAWEVVVPDRNEIWRSGTMSLASDTFHEFGIPANLLDKDGNLRVEFINPNDVGLLFPLEDGFEVLYREGSFGPNYARGMTIILCWMGLLAAIGLSAASFLSFPVAAFFSLAVFAVGMSGGTLATVVEYGTVLGINEESMIPSSSVLDAIFVFVFSKMLAVINLVKDFSPVEFLSSGRRITWLQLGRAVLQIVLFMGGIFAVIGITAFNRRELATAQGNQ